MKLHLTDNHLILRKTSKKKKKHNVVELHDKITSNQFAMLEKKIFCVFRLKPFDCSSGHLLQREVFAVINWIK